MVNFLFKFKCNASVSKTDNVGAWVVNILSICVAKITNFKCLLL